MITKSNRSLTPGPRSAARRPRPTRTRRGAHRATRRALPEHRAARLRPRATPPSACRPTTDGAARRRCRSRRRRCAPRRALPLPARHRTHRRETSTRASSRRPSSGSRADRPRVARIPRSRYRPTQRRRLPIGARRRAIANGAVLLDQSLLLQPRRRDVLVVLLIDGHLLVHVVELRLGQLRADGVQELLQRPVVLRDEVLPNDRRDVVGELQVLVVVEEDEVLRDDARIAGEEQPDVDLLALERRDGQRTPSIYRLEVLEREAVDVREAEL